VTATGLRFVGNLAGSADHWWSGHQERRLARGNLIEEVARSELALDDR